MKTQGLGRGDPDLPLPGAAARSTILTATPAGVRIGVSRTREEHFLLSPAHFRFLVSEGDAAITMK